MTSVGSIIVGSVPTAQSFRDAVESYRRAQYLVAGSTVSSASYEDEGLDGEPYASDTDDVFEEEQAIRHSSSRDDFISQLDWDEPLASTGSDSYNSAPRLIIPQTPETSPHLISTERTPLISRKVSFSQAAHPPRDTNHISPPIPEPSPDERIRRRSSMSSMKSKKVHGGRSTFGQTLFNSIAILLGIGMLSEPLAFSYAGWICGTLILIVYGVVTCYTSKILAHIILDDARLRSYSDIGRKAFGSRSSLPISLMFCLELFAVAVVLVTLASDSLHSIFPVYSSNTYKICGLIAVIPTVFLPLSLLSYTSILGILSTILIVVVIIIDGFSKKVAPGSLYDPAETSLGVGNLNQLALSFGLFMAGFSGHSVIPSLARDMSDPGQFDRMINWAFAVATGIYTLVGVAGYVMFGNAVSDEVSIDLGRTPGYNKALNKAALGLLVVMPLSKFALTTQPLNMTIQILLGIDSPIVTPEDVAGMPSAISIPSTRRLAVKLAATAQRVVVTVGAVVVSILIPEFAVMMAFLGSFSAFLLCVIGPICAKIALNRRCGWLDGLLLVLGTISAFWGTVAAVMSDQNVD